MCCCSLAICSCEMTGQWTARRTFYKLSHHTRKHTTHTSECDPSFNKNTDWMSINATQKQHGNWTSCRWVAIKGTSFLIHPRSPSLPTTVAGPTTKHHALTSRRGRWSKLRGGLKLFVSSRDGVQSHTHIHTHINTRTRIHTSIHTYIHTHRLEAR